jgi:tetratricopeptide (TPR) repeat protein
MARQALILACILAARAARADDARDRDAQELYRQAVAEYNLGEYEPAIEKFKASYKLSQQPLLLFDIAQAYRLQGAGSCRNAQQFYRTYLRVQPAAPNRAQVEQWLRELEPCAQQEPVVEPPTPTPTTTPPPSRSPVHAPAAVHPVPPPPHSEPSHTLRWTLIGGGVVVLAAGGGVLAWTAHDYDAAKTSCYPHCNSTRDSLQLHADVSYALLGLGGALAATGVVLWIRGDGETERAAYIAPAPTGVVIGGRF